jgi:hypothetical protein
MRATAAAALITLAFGASALAQTSIDPNHKFSWQENCGWMNWADANGGSQGVHDGATFLSGYIWGENIGWINFGNTPASRIHYTNLDGSSFGVNIDGTTGNLSGFAWGENVGWINFGGGALASPPQPASFDSTAGRFRGYAWGENIGWINLDDSTDYVKRLCYPNCDGSTTIPVLNVTDFTCFLQKFSRGDPYANCDRSDTAPVLSVNDFTCFLQRFAQGCQ